jgi:RNA polymerase primary sigma factor
MTTNALETYCKKASKHKLLTKEEEFKLADDKTSQQSKNALIKSNLKLVMSIANKYQGRGLELEDLIQEGNIGLMKAVEKFDTSKDLRFSTYATWWIKQSILQAISDQSKMIRIPTYLNEIIREIKETKKLLENKFGGEPTAKMIADHMNVPEEKVCEILSAIAEPTSIETPIDEKLTLESTLVDDSISILEQMVKQETNELLLNFLAILNEKERFIIEKRFGISQEKTYTLEEVGQLLTITSERVRQLEARALQKITKKALTESVNEAV